MSYKLRYTDKGLLRISGYIEAGLTLSKTFDNAFYDIDLVLSDVEFQGTVHVFCDDVDRFLRTKKGLRAVLSLEIANFRVEGSGALTVRALRALLRRAGRVEVEL